MPQITAATLRRASRSYNPGLGQAADPDALDAQADALMAQAVAMNAQTQGTGADLAAQANDLHAQAAAIRQQQAAASSAQTQADVSAIGKSILGASSAFAPAALKLFGAGGGPGAPAFSAQPRFSVPPAGGGMTTGTKVALGLGALAAAGLLLWAVVKK